MLIQKTARLTDPAALRQKLLAPRSIALIGASDDATKNAARPLTFLRRGGYSGTIYPVNPRRNTVLGETGINCDSPIRRASSHSCSDTATICRCARLVTMYVNVWLALFSVNVNRHQRIAFVNSPAVSNSELPIAPNLGKARPAPVFIFKTFRGVARARPHTVLGNAPAVLGSSVAHIKAVRCPEHS